MNLHRLLAQRTADPVCVGLIGAGKFASMFLAQARVTPGLHVLAVCDLDPERAREALRSTGWPEAALAAADTVSARARGATWITADAARLAAAPGLDVIVEATGDPVAGVRHALAGLEARRHVIMVNVEADVLAGPLLAARAREAGVVYSLAYGDQPALVCELVDWARASGFEVMCAGKGTKYLPEYHRSTPETVWRHYGLDPEAAVHGGLNPRMFNSFLDGTKSAIEMAAIANATGLEPQSRGLGFPPCGAGALAGVLRPRAEGGVLEHAGTVEVVSSLERDGRPVADDLRWGVYVVFRAASDYVARCFAEYGIASDESGRYAALYRPYHLIGLELGVSVASVCLRGEATGAPAAFVADVAAVAKRDLAAGEALDGEGGHSVYGRLMPAGDSLARGALPIGLAAGARLRRAVAADAIVARTDATLACAPEVTALRAEMEARFARGGSGAG